MDSYGELQFDQFDDVGTLDLADALEDVSKTDNDTLDDIFGADGYYIVRY
jgi:hypothetical protein